MNIRFLVSLGLVVTGMANAAEVGSVREEVRERYSLQSFYQKFVDAAFFPFVRVELAQEFPETAGLMTEHWEAIPVSVSRVN